MEDMCVLIGTWYNDKSKDKAAFYTKLKELGYLKDTGNQPAEAEKQPGIAEKQPAMAEKPSAATENKGTEVNQPQIAAKEYAWVLIDVADLTREELIKGQNESYKGVYEYASSYSQGTIQDRKTYVGKTDTYPDPDKVQGEGLILQATWSKPPNVIKKDQVVSLNLSLSVAQNTQSFFQFGGTIDAFFDTESVARGGGRTGNAIRLANKDNKNSFEVSAKNHYAAANETVSAKPRSGSKPGDRMGLTVGGCIFQARTGYIYEWKEI